MAAELEILAGSKPESNTGVAVIEVVKIVMDSGSVYSLPILLDGKKLASLHALTLTSTEITFEGSNFGSDLSANGADDFEKGHRIPVTGDFSPLFDQSDAEVKLSATTGNKIWSLPDVGYLLWVRLKFSVAQTKTLYMALKG